MLSTPVGRVRAAGLVEGVSALLLFFVAMPLKYGPPAGSELALLGKQVVFYVGAVHGGLFVLYALITFVAWGQGALTFKLVAFVAWGQGALTFKLVALAAVASIVPFGPFFIDRKLKAHEASARPDTATPSR